MADRILALAERSSRVERNLDSKLSRRKKHALSNKQQAQKRQAFQLRRRLVRGVSPSVKPSKEVVTRTTRDRNRSRLAKQLSVVDSFDDTPIVPYFDPRFDSYIFESSSDEDWIDEDCGPMPTEIDGCCVYCMYWH